MSGECGNDIKSGNNGINEEACRDQDQASAAAEIIRQFAHDLRQPVSAILALAAAGTAEPQVAEAVQRRLSKIADEAGWLCDIVDDLLNGTGTAHGAEPVEISSLVRDVVASELVTYQGRILVHQHDTDRGTIRDGSGNAPATRGRQCSGQCHPRSWSGRRGRGDSAPSGRFGTY